MKTQAECGRLHVPERDCESNGETIKMLPSIREDEEGSGSEGERSPHPKAPPLGRLGRGLRSPLRSPLLPARAFRLASGEPARPPASLQMPAVSFTCLQPDLSSRFVDGIETENQSSSAQTCDFSPSTSQSCLPSGDSSTSGDHDEGDTMQTVAKLKHEMNVLSHQVTAVSQELQEMTRLLKPFFRSTSLLPAQDAPLDCFDGQSPPLILAPESSPQPSMAKVLREEFDPLQRSPSRVIASHNTPVPQPTSTGPAAPYCSAPPSLHSSPSSVPSLSSPSRRPSLTPLLVDISGPASEPQSRLLPPPESQFLFQPSRVASRISEPPLNLQEVEWSGGGDGREHTAQLSFINEGQPLV